MTEAKRPLVIGIGNVLRSDDGAGYQVAEALRNEINRSLEVITVHQLTPELALYIGSASRVLFVDASVEQLFSALKPLAEHQNATPSSTPVGVGHSITPDMLMALARVLYDHCPPAWELLIPAQRWDHGTKLSGLTAEGCTQALLMAKAWGHGHA